MRSKLKGMLWRQKVEKQANFPPCTSNVFASETQTKFDFKTATKQKFRSTHHFRAEKRSQKLPATMQIKSYFAVLIGLSLALSVSFTQIWNFSSREFTSLRLKFDLSRKTKFRYLASNTRIVVVVLENYLRVTVGCVRGWRQSTKFLKPPTKWICKKILDFFFRKNSKVKKTL